MGTIGDPSITGIYDLADYRTNAPEPAPAYESWLTTSNFRSAFGLDPSVTFEDCSGPVYNNF